MKLLDYQDCLGIMCMHASVDTHEACKCWIHTTVYIRIFSDYDGSFLTLLANTVASLFSTRSKD
jgi:hypothetical protein